ncbi:hypothetical protein BH20GEM1_BH20GEM1_05880 [soil metagenome]
MRGNVRRILVVLGVAAVAGAFGASGAGGHGAIVRLGAQAISAGDSLAVTGEGLGVREEITLALEGAAGRKVLATLRGDAHGRFETVVAIPVETPAGAYRIVAEGGEERATADLLVTAAVGGERAQASPTTIPEPPEAMAGEMRLERRRSTAETAIAWGLVGTLIILGAWLARWPTRPS